MRLDQVMESDKILIAPYVNFEKGLEIASTSFTHYFVVPYEASLQFPPLPEPIRYHSRFLCNYHTDFTSKSILCILYKCHFPSMNTTKSLNNPP